MNEELLKELIKTRSVLKQKYRSLKVGEIENDEKLEKTFKPITEPLKELVKNNKTIYNNTINENFNDQNNLFDFHNMLSKVETSTPKKEFQLKNDGVNDYDDDDTKITNEANSMDGTFNSANNSTNVINLSLLQKNKLLDTTYGPYKNSNNVWKFGNSDIEISEEKINVANQNWALTPGLIELLFHKEPKNYEPYELDIYKNILIKTNAHKRNYNSKNQIKGTKSKKYKNIIKKLFKDEISATPNKSLTLKKSLRSQTHKGDGMIMKYNNEKPNYIYWNDPNELVDRLRLLIASEGAGHNNHRNEINSILEELKEANIII